MFHIQTTETRTSGTYQRGRLDGGEAALVLVVLGLAALVGGGRPEPLQVVPVEPVVPVVLMVLRGTHRHAN